MDKIQKHLVLVSPCAEELINRCNILHGRVIILKSDDVSIFFYAVEEERDMIASILQSYFRLLHDLKKLYKEWAIRDHYFAQTAIKYRAIRLLEQSPFESLLSFICSQNNGIARITTMVRTLKELYGTHRARINGDLNLYDFPTPSDLLGSEVELSLRKSGFGYRAPYIGLVATMIAERKLNLEGLRTVTYDEAWKTLLGIKGVGPKVADCVALTGLGHMDAVPIDTHLWRIGRTHYINMPKTNALNPKVYKAIGEQYRKIFGPMAGWAHLILFAAQIRKRRNEK